MQSSYRIFRIFGISVELHITFILFFLFLFLVNWAQGGLISGIGTLILFTILFTIVLLHELLHSIVAIFNGIKVPNIVLLPIGGMASVELPQKPEKELMIAISGPLLNFFIAILSGIILILISPTDFIQVFIVSMQNMWDKTPEVIFNLPGLLSVLVYINLMLGFFNMLPGFPMDGGRVFRAVLALWMDYVKATEIAVRIGQFIFLLMIFFGFFSNFFLVIIGMFLFFASGSELNLAELRKSLHDLTVGAIAIRNFNFVNEPETLKEFFEMIAKPGQNYYIVVDFSGKIVGVLSIRDLENLKAEDIEKLRVKDFAKNFEFIDAKEKVEEKLHELLSKEFLLVVSEDKKQIIGYLTPEYVLEFARFYGITHKTSS